MLDINRSIAIATQLGGREKSCWENALLAFLTYEDLQTGWYVEGWAIPDRSIPLNVEHGWVECADGSIIDPTFAALGDRGVVYFPGVRYTYSEVKRRAGGNRPIKLPLIRQYGAGGFAHSAYLQAYNVSQLYASEKVVHTRNKSVTNG